MHFVKFETARIQDCLDFIEAKGLHRCRGRDGQAREVRVKATGGGAYKFADLFYERLGLTVEKEDEIGCSVAGCNFLLRAIAHEAFLYEGGQATFVPTNGAWLVRCRCLRKDPPRGAPDAFFSTRERALTPPFSHHHQTHPKSSSTTLPPLKTQQPTATSSPTCSSTSARASASSR
jgi:hypothetical protein